MTKTLRMLEEGGVDLGVVEVWVPGPVECFEYRQALPAEVEVRIAHHDPHDARVEVVGVEPVAVGLARNTIIRAHPPGTRLVFVDDDITGVFEAKSRRDLERVEDLPNLFTNLFRDADAASATISGIYPVHNPYFMRPRVRYDLTYICAGLFGIIVTGRPCEMVTLDDKEDFERSIRHYLADGHVVRNEHYCIGTDGYHGAGGMQLSRTPLRVRASAEWLVRQYPDLCSLNLSKRSGWAEVRLRDVRKRLAVPDPA